MFRAEDKGLIVKTKLFLSFVHTDGDEKKLKCWQSMLCPKG